MKTTNYFRQNVFLIITLMIFSCNDKNEVLKSNNLTEKQNEIVLRESATSTEIDVKFHHNHTNELLITLNQKNNEFKNYFIVQSETRFKRDLFINDSYSIVLNSNNLILSNNSRHIIFTLNDEKLNNYNNNKTTNYISVYGISKRFSGDVVLNLDEKNKRQGELTCHSGGEGASECSSESGSPLGGNCSVSCREGYYACCDDTKNECKCKPLEDDNTVTHP
jgi:hypothetical protein